MAAGIITGAVTSITGQVIGALDDLFTSDEERAVFELRKAEITERIEARLMQPQLLQAETTLKEAEHSSVFVAGWRPALGWVAASGLAWEFILRPVIASTLHIVSLSGWNPVGCIQAAADLPHLDAEQLMALVAVLLGVAGFRSFEKAKGVARGNLK